MVENDDKPKTTVEGESEEAVQRLDERSKALLAMDQIGSDGSEKEDGADDGDAYRANMEMEGRAKTR